MASDDSLALSGLRADAFTEALVALVRLMPPPSMDVVVLASRALALLLDAFPVTVAATAVQHGVIEALVEKLLAIEYMDVAESSLQILDRLCADHGDDNNRHGSTHRIIGRTSTASSTTTTTTTTTQEQQDNSSQARRNRVVAASGLVALLHPTGPGSPLAAQPPSRSPYSSCWC